VLYAHGPCEAARGAWGLALAVTLLASAGGAAAAWVELDSGRAWSSCSGVGVFFSYQPSANFYCNRHNETHG